MDEEAREKETLAGEMLEEAKKLFYDNHIGEAIELAQRSAELFAEIGDWDMYAGSLNILGVFNYALGNYDLSETYYIKALDVAQEHNLRETMSKIYNNIGSEYQGFHDMEKARMYFDLSLESFSPDEYEGSKTNLAVIYMNICENYSNLGNMEKAIEYLELARTLLQTDGSRPQIFSFKAFESKIMWKCGHEDYVRAHLDELMDIALGCNNVIDFKENIQDLCETLVWAKEYDRLRRLIEHCEESCTDDNIKLKLTTIDLWLRYYREIKDRQGYLEKCAQYYDTTILENNLELASRAESLTTKLELRKTRKEREQADKISKIDALTGVKNRACMLEESRDIIRHSAQNRTGIGVGLLDIDFFKECNDTYGHVKGDECIKKVAQAIQKIVGDSGNLYRYGGDEFLILMEDARAETLEKVGAGIKEELSNLKIPNSKSPFDGIVTVSQGYTLAVADEGDSIETLLDWVDHVLYQVKRYGRNDYRFMQLSQILKELD